MPKIGSGFFIVYLLALVLFMLDQGTKSYIVDHYALYESRVIWEPWLYFTHVRNDGAAFSTFRGQMGWLSLVAVAVVIGIIIYERRLPPDRPTLLSLSLGFLLGGALGNLLDRISLSYVVDFMDLHYQGRNIWPIFNVADICINVGVGLLLLYFMLYPQKDETKKAAAASQEEGASYGKMDGKS